MDTKMKNTKTNYQNQEMNLETTKNLYIGIDVHKNSWKVTIVSDGKELYQNDANPNAAELSKYLRKRYPGFNYYSVYESGFCGASVHRELEKVGIKNIIVNAADVPTTHKEKKQKTDSIDSRKLAFALSKEMLTGIAIPNTQQEANRGLSRLREQFVKKQTEIKNQIKSLLNRNKIKIIEQYKIGRWSNQYIMYLRKLKFSHSETNYELRILLDTLVQYRNTLADILKEIRRVISMNEEMERKINAIKTIPGIGIVTAYTLYTELWDITRFKNFDKLASYVGLSPACHNSGSKETNLGLTSRKNARLRNALIESSWVAIRYDPELKDKYSGLLSTSSGQKRGNNDVKKAIIRIAKKLLNRIRTIWITETPYIKEYSLNKNKKIDTNKIKEIKIFKGTEIKQE